MSMVEGGALGVNVWWTVPEALVDGDAAQVAVESAGFERKDIVPASFRRAASRACYNMQDRRSNEHRRVTEKVKTADGKVVFGILDRVDGQEEVSFEQKTKVIVDGKNNELVAFGEVADKVRTEFDANLGRVNSADIRAFIGKVVRLCYGIPKRPSGGIYFVPAQFADLIESARQAVENMFPAGKGAVPRIYTERVFNGEEERRNVADSVADDLRGEINKIMAGIESISRSSKALKDREGKLHMVEQMAKLYEEILGKEAEYEDLIEELRGAETKLVARMTEMDESRKARKPAKVERVTLDKVIRKTLADAGRPMRVPEIVDAIKASGAYELPETNAIPSVAGTLSRVTKTDESGIAKVGRGLYEVAAG